jgi:hypothetical protein
VKFILNNVNLTIAKKFSQSLFILTFGSLEGLREFEFLGRTEGNFGNIFGESVGVFGEKFDFVTAVIITAVTKF